MSQYFFSAKYSAVAVKGSMVFQRMERSFFLFAFKDLPLQSSWAYCLLIFFSILTMISCNSFIQVGLKKKRHWYRRVKEEPSQEGQLSFIPRLRWLCKQSHLPFCFPPPSLSFQPVAQPDNLVPFIGSCPWAFIILFVPWIGKRV